MKIILILFISCITLVNINEVIANSTNNNEGRTTTIEEDLNNFYKDYDNYVIDSNTHSTQYEAMLERYWPSLREFSIRFLWDRMLDL